MKFDDKVIKKNKEILCKTRYKLNSKSFGIMPVRVLFHDCKTAAITTRCPSLKKQLAAYFIKENVHNLP